MKKKKFKLEVQVKKELEAGVVNLLTSWPMQNGVTAPLTRNNISKACSPRQTYIKSFFYLKCFK